MPNVTVPLSELVRATTFFKTKRIPKGAKANIATDTILGFHQDCLIIESPTNVSMIKISGGFECRLSVSAKGFNLLLGQIPQNEKVILAYSKKDKALAVMSGGVEIKLAAEELR